MSKPVDLSLQARYRTVWPALVTRMAAAATKSTVVACALGRPRWLRAVNASLLALVPVIAIWTAWLICAVLFVLWPLGWLAMLPTRIAVGRGVSQLGVVYTLCWVNLFTWYLFGVLWIVALVMASRDPKVVPHPGVAS